MFSKGGIRRQKYTYPALIFAMYKHATLVGKAQAHVRPPARLTTQEEEEEEEEKKLRPPQITLQKIFYQVNELTNQLSSHYPEVTLRLLLQGCLCINSIFDKSNHLEDLAYDFASHALLVYQDELSDSEARFSSINLIVSTLSHLRCFNQENQDTLCTNTAQYCNKLLKKPNQCSAISMCTHLFMNHGPVCPERLSPC